MNRTPQKQRSAGNAAHRRGAELQSVHGGRSGQPADPTFTPPIPPTTTALSRAAIAVIAPAVAAIAHGFHPWIGNPGDPDFLARLAAAVAADPTRWALSHLGVAVASGLLALAFLAIRNWLREAGEARWSALGLPLVVLGSVFYAMLPAIEFAPLGALEAGADPAAVQAALMPWFVGILMTAAGLFALGVLGFAIGIFRSRVLSRRLTWLVVGALAVMAATRFFPVGAAQLYVGPAAGLVALWPLAFAMWAHAQVRRTREPNSATAPAHS